MDSSYWDKTLQNYAAEVVSVYDMDAGQVVAKVIQHLARTESCDSAADLVIANLKVIHKWRNKIDPPRGVGVPLPSEA